VNSTRSKDSIKIATKKESPLGYIEFDLPFTIARTGRRVKQSLHIKKLCLSPPEDKVTKAGYRPVHVTVILAQEIGAPRSKSRSKKYVDWTTGLARVYQSKRYVHQSLWPYLWVKIRVLPGNRLRNFFHV
jgi:hypothetical protein